ncbi:MAG: hypothetical protein ACHBN1_15160 [Heteroscytonema crispum UTEX LB 1556]
MQTKSLKIASLCATLIGSQLIFGSSHAGTPNVSSLVGEWSQKGLCNKVRYVYTFNGKYMTLEKKAGKWKTTYQGIYVYTPGQLVIADGPNMGGVTAKIDELNRNAFRGEWLTSAENDNLDSKERKDEPFNYVKCGKR